VSLEKAINKRNANKYKEHSEKDLAGLESGLRVGGHGDQKILAQR
jgi:hypothetical protein